MLRVRTEFTGVAGSPWLSNHMFDEADEVTPQQAVNYVGAFWEALAPLIVSAVSWTVSGEVLSVSPATGEATESFNVNPINGVGESGGEMLPTATQLLIRWSTGVFVGGRRIAGKTYVPGISEAHNDGGIPLPSVAPFVTAAVDALVGPVGDTGFGIYSRTNNVLVVATGGSYAPQWAVLRSRRD